MDQLNNLRRRLTLTYTLVLGGLSVLTAVVLFLAILFSTERYITQNLEISASQLANAYETQLKEKDEAAYLNITQTLEENNTTFRIYNDELKVSLSSNENVISEEDSQYLFRNMLINNKADSQITNFYLGSKSFKALTKAYATGSGNLLIIQLIRNMSEQRYFFINPLLLVFLIILTGVILSFILGNFLAGHALKPVRESTENQKIFLANASHELRTPIAVVLANLEALKESEDNEFLNNCLNETKRAKSLIEDLLYLAKIDAGENQRISQPVDLSYIILNVLERLTELAKNKDIRLYSNYLQEDLIVLGDEAQLTELVTILVENAIKYTNNGGQVIVDLFKEDEKIVLKIKDNGIGISKEDQTHIFERFYRVDKVRSRKEGGTGLGLSIAQSIIKEEQINLELESELEVGTTFSLTFKPWST